MKGGGLDINPLHWSENRLINTAFILLILLILVNSDIFVPKTTPIVNQTISNSHTGLVAAQTTEVEPTPNLIATDSKGSLETMMDWFTQLGARIWPTNPNAGWVVFAVILFILLRAWSFSSRALDELIWSKYKKKND